MMSKIFICFCSFFFFCSLNAHGQNITRNGSADLDGDGRQDSIHLIVDSRGEYVLEINDASAKGKLPDPASLCDEAKFQMDIIDLDKRDKYKEVRILMYSGIDSCMDFTHHILGYSGTSIDLMMKLEGEQPTFSGDGIVLVTEWRNFWLKTDKYALDPKTGTLKHVPQAFYYVGVEAKVVKSISVFQTTSRTTIVANLKKDSTCLILLFDAPSGCYLIKSETGLTGWTSDVQKLALPSAG